LEEKKKRKRNCARQWGSRDEYNISSSWTSLLGEEGFQSLNSRNGLFSILNEAVKKASNLFAQLLSWKYNTMVMSTVLRFMQTWVCV
jgi:hypothetical protein